MWEYNSRSKAYDIVQSFVNTLELKEIDYDKMSWRWKWVTELTSWKFMGITFRIVFYEMWHPCAYIKIPDDSSLIQILKEKGYDEIPCQTCHWWITFWQRTTDEDKRGFTKGRRIGWDYWHAWDYTDYMKDLSFVEELRKRTTEDILIEVVEQILALKDWEYL